MDRAALRTKRHSRKFRKFPTLNLVSLMDIFTILLLFLIAMSGEESVLPTSENLTLPASISKNMPMPAIVVMITKDEILVSGRAVERVRNIAGGDENLIVSVKKALDLEAKKSQFISSQNSDIKFEGKINLMADKDIPYKIIKKVMFTATQASFSKISLAVINKNG